eukprot:TRINITY_DN5727_c0_g1_i1.p1 TRINITY_DN5727_c0_g1~~TRINITY_DN5727_c0_g1_i1.p1  ORF type:complete len:193 (-),score=61.63 TRINITY_DN5727_c0_g1_i1:95-649(-)
MTTAAHTTLTTEQLDGLIRTIEDFPKPGISFKDITPLLADCKGLSSICDLMAEPYKGKGITQVVGLEARGFIFGTPIAERLGCGFVPARKPGKLPAATVSVDYSLEYGTNTLEMHVDALKEGDRVLIVDDLLATGGTANAAISLVQKTDATIVGAVFAIELKGLEGRKKMGDGGGEVHVILSYD